MEHSQSLHIATSNGGKYIGSLAQLTSKSEYTILYFYPKDCTTGCTLEAREFSMMIKDFAKLWATIIGVSKDTIDSHHKFISQSDLGIDLISDGDLGLHHAFGVRVEKKMYWRSYMWTARSTFILDTSGKIITKYTKVTTRGHAQLVYNDLKSQL